MFLVESIVALILTTILPHIVAISVHDSVLELALEVATIGPLEAALSTHFIIRPHACVLGAVGPEVDTLALLNAVTEVSVVVASI